MKDRLIVGEHGTADPWALSCLTFFLFEKVNDEFVLLACLRNCGRRFCCCRHLVFGMVAVVAIVLSVDVTGGGSVRNVSALRAWTYMDVVVAVRVVVVHVAPQVEGDDAYVVLTVVVVVSFLFVLGDLQFIVIVVVVGVAVTAHFWV